MTQETIKLNVTITEASPVFPLKARGEVLEVIEGVEVPHADCWNDWDGFIDLSLCCKAVRKLGIIPPECEAWVSVAS
jgi:hypothetical protein